MCHLLDHACQIAWKCVVMGVGFLTTSICAAVLNSMFSEYSDPLVSLSCVCIVFGSLCISRALWLHCSNQEISDSMRHEVMRQHVLPQMSTQSAGCVSVLTMQHDRLFPPSYSAAVSENRFLSISQCEADMNPDNSSIVDLLVGLSEDRKPSRPTSLRNKCCMDETAPLTGMSCSSCGAVVLLAAPICGGQWQLRNAHSLPRIAERETVIDIAAARRQVSFNSPMSDAPPPYGPQSSEGSASTASTSLAVSGFPSPL